ncbi:TerC family protein [Azotosporobacter soli]|uniref:TerC family protein n=1 Tax=Azotosporobacter soli TaxID=3055040 RepID=UPI0031FEFD5D
MDTPMLLEYLWVLLILILLEGILAADNALVLAALVKPLPPDTRRKALFYGLVGAFFFRFLSLFLVSVLANYWQFQALGAAYLLYLGLSHIIRRLVLHQSSQTEESSDAASSLWLTVVKVEIADAAFAVDAIFAAMALAVTLPDSGLPVFGGMDGGKFALILLGGLIGIVIMRLAAEFFVKLLLSHPGLELAAFAIVGWVGVKLTVFTLSHPQIALLPETFPSHPLWKAVFWAVFLLLFFWGYRWKPADKRAPF